MKIQTEPILICVDDRDDNLDFLEQRAIRAQLRPVRCKSGADAITKIDELSTNADFVAVVTDLKMEVPEAGWDVLRHAYNVSKSVLPKSLILWGKSEEMGGDGRSAAA